MTRFLDSYDKRILFELDKNARSSVSGLATQVKKSKQFVDYRIRKLEERRIIRGYASVIDYSKLGYISIRVYLKFHNITPEQQQSIEEELVKDKEVWWLVTLEGPWDVGYAMAVKNVLSFYAYWDRVMKKYRQYISRRSVVIYTHIRQYPKSYIVNQANTAAGTLVGASEQTVPIDEMDFGILRLISDNARMTLLEIARKNKTSPQVVRNRLKRLEKIGVLQGYRALIDVSFLGYRYYKSYLDLVHTDRLRELESFCAQHQNILNVNRTIGGKDFEIELQAKSFDEFERIMNELRTRFAGMIDEYEFVVAREEKKMTYFPFG
jgi:DNA-binding Lrp family transcriptional regulator